MTGAKPRNSANPARTGKALALSGFLAVQIAATGFFLFEAAADLTGWNYLSTGRAHDFLEIIAVVVLVTGIVLTTREVRRLRTRQRRIEAQLRVASGAFLELLEEYFEEWALTPSERDVALLAIKGLSIAEIAAVRNTKVGTVKAQCNAIYSKAEVSGRQQLLSLFIEELMAERLVPGEAAAP